jgi:hypothetical protein
LDDVDIYYNQNKNKPPTMDKDQAQYDSNDNPIRYGTQQVPHINEDSKAARFFHGIGHVIYQKANEQESVIDYDNKARSIFKVETKKGKYISAPEASRPYDKSHTNQN